MKKTTITILFGLFIGSGLVGSGFSQTPFYAGKMITVVMGSETGGSGDMRTRILISYLRTHIPGNPLMVVNYESGAGGKKAANYLYKLARPDGLTIGSMSAGFLPADLLGEEGVFYDVDKMVYLGGQALSSPYVFLSRKGAGLSTLEKLQAAREIRIGAQSVGHITYIGARMFAFLLGMREPRFVTGYSPTQISLALERGEVDAGMNPADTILRRNQDWVDKELVDFHALIEVPEGRKYPHLPFNKLPDLARFARSDTERNVVALHRAFRLVGMILVVPPGTPKDKVQILQEAMRQTFKDTNFYTEYKKMIKEDADPLTPEELQRAIHDLPRERGAMELFKKLSGPDPLPMR
jgi:tripartite-type tricarboxylate transporter receptor subunit TctC